MLIPGYLEKNNHLECECRRHRPKYEGGTVSWQKKIAKKRASGAIVTPCRVATR